MLIDCDEIYLTPRPPVPLDFSMSTVVVWDVV